VRQGRTDAWVAHKLDITVEELQQFKREQELEGEPPRALAPLMAGDLPPALEELEGEPIADPDDEEDDEEGDEEEEEAVEDVAPGDEAEGGDGADDDAESTFAKRRRGRRGGRRRRSPRRQSSYEGTFEHGGEGYGLWLDPSVADSDVYSEHWAGHRDVTVTVEADAITIRRSGS